MQDKSWMQLPKPRRKFILLGAFTESSVTDFYRLTEGFLVIKTEDSIWRQPILSWIFGVQFDGKDFSLQKSGILSPEYNSLLKTLRTQMATRISVAELFAGIWKNKKNLAGITMVIFPARFLS